MSKEKIINDLSEHLETLAKELNDYKNAKIKCGIIGRSGTGKSSLINAIAGKEIAQVDEIESTKSISEPYENNGLLIYDLPGSSTESFPKETYVQDMKIAELDCVIFVTANRFYEEDKFLIKEINKISVPIFLVRSQMDISVIQAAKRNIHESETLNKIYDNIKESVVDCKYKGIYLTSSEYPTKYDLGKLLSDISKNLSDIKKEKFFASVSTSSQEILDEKQRVAEKLVIRYSALAAANGLNPIPGLDISVDLGILLKMTNDIADIFGLKEENLKRLEDISGSAKIKLITGKAGQFLVKYGTKEGIMILLKKYAASETIKVVGKWVPYVGTVISASIGYLLTSNMGNEILIESKSLAQQLFDSLKEDANDSL